MPKPGDMRVTGETVEIFDISETGEIAWLPCHEQPIGFWEGVPIFEPRRIHHAIAPGGWRR